MRQVRSHRAAAGGHRLRWHVLPMRRPAKPAWLRSLRCGQAGRCSHQRWPADLRTVPPRRTRAPRMRELRHDRLDRRAGPRRTTRRMRELLPDARGRLQRVRPPPRMQLRRQPHTDLPDLLTARHRDLRSLRPRPPTRGPLGRRPALRPLLHRRVAPSRSVPNLRAAAAAGRPTRTPGHPVRRLRRPARHPRLHRLRPGGQALREGPMRPVQPAPPSCSAAQPGRCPPS